MLINGVRMMLLHLFIHVYNFALYGWSIILCLSGFFRHFMYPLMIVCMLPV